MKKISKITTVGLAIGMAAFLLTGCGTDTADSVEESSVASAEEVLSSEELEDEQVEEETVDAELSEEEAEEQAEETEIETESEESISRISLEEWFEDLYTAAAQDDFEAVSACFDSEISEEYVDALDEYFQVLYAKQDVSCQVIDETDEYVIVGLLGKDGETDESQVRLGFALEKTDSTYIVSGELGANHQCGNCGGSGSVAKETSSQTVCPTCGGSGQIQQTTSYYDAIMGWQYQYYYVACGSCGGSGYIGSGSTEYQTCNQCSGFGFVK